jgi:hypothetical protein
LAADTQILDTIYTPDGQLWNGTLTISLVDNTYSALKTYAGWERTVRVVNGVITPPLYLVSNTLLTPTNTRYKVIYTSQSLRRVEYWLVPDQASATIRSIRTNIDQSPPPAGTQAGGDLVGYYPNPTLTATGIMAGTYGSASNVPQVTFDSKGRATAAANVPLSIALSGDVTGGTANTLVTKLRGSSISSTAPSIDGQMLRWNNSSAQYEPADYVSLARTWDSTANQIYAFQYPSVIHDASASTGVDYTLSTTYVAFKFTAASAYNLRAVGLRLKATGSITNDTSTLSAYLYADNAGVPSSVLTSGNLTRYGSLTTSYAEYKFGLALTLSQGATYWIVLVESAAPSGGTIYFDAAGSGSGQVATSANGTSWSQVNGYTFWFKLYGRTGYVANLYSETNAAIYSSSWTSYGVWGNSVQSNGVTGTSTDGIGVLGGSQRTFGVYGSSDRSTGVYGFSPVEVGTRGRSIQHIGVYADQGGTLASTTSSPTLYAWRNYASLGGYDATGAVILGEDSTASSGPLLRLVKQGLTRLTVDNVGNLDIAGSFKVNGTALASTHLSDSSSLVRKSGTYTLGNAARINASGQLESVSGNATDCVLVNGSSGACGSGGGGAVSSVFGRTGAVVAQTGDYSFSQISGTVANSQVASGVDATKIGSGTVSNTAFGYLANVTSDIQAQLNSKASTTHTHTLGGDVTGDIANTTVGKLQGRAVASTAPSDAQALVWSAANNQWQPGTVSGSGGAGMAAQLGDFSVSRTSSTVLTIGSGCSATTPCNVRFGSTTYRVTTSATATISAGSGTSYIYLDGAGVIYVADSLTVVCSGCTHTSGAAFPVTAIPIATWSATSGAWDASGGLDYRAMLSAKRVSGGTNISVTDAGTDAQVGLDTASALSWTGSINLSGAASTISWKTGTTLPSTCSVGESFFKTNASAGQNVYGCTATNTWTLQGGSGGGLNYFDHTVFHEVEQFCGTTGTTLAIGTQTRWGTSGIGGGTAVAAANAGDAQHVCTARLGTGATVGYGTGFYEYPTAQVVNASVNYTWQVEYIFMLESTATTSARTYIGLTDTYGAVPPTNFIGLRFDTNLGDAAFQYQACTSGTCTTTSSGVAPVGGTFYRVRMRGTALGTWAFCLNACGTETTINTNVPTASLTPAVMIATDTTVAKFMQVDKFEIERTGLSAY